MENIKITRTLLEKSENEMTKEEMEIVKERKEKIEKRWDIVEKNNEKIVSDCKMLFSGLDHNPIVDYGWMYAIEELCYKLEGLNYDYSKYGLKVVADQTKEKFGTLRFYTHIEQNPIGFIGGLCRFFHYLSIKTQVSEMERVVDVPGYTTIEWREITKEQYDTKCDNYGNPLQNAFFDVLFTKDRDSVSITQLVNYRYLLEENGKYYFSFPLYHCPKCHMEPKNHKIRYMFSKIINNISYWISNFYKEPTIQCVKHNEFEYKVDELIMIAEQKCMGVCQHCGVTFRDFNPRCETLGWTTYICEECASAMGVQYLKQNDKNIYCEGKVVEK
jgi:hypothetical protein